MIVVGRRFSGVMIEVGKNAVGDDSRFFATKLSESARKVAAAVFFFFGVDNSEVTIENLKWDYTGIKVESLFCCNYRLLISKAHIIVIQ